MTSLRLFTLACLSLATSSCELAEVATPDGTDLLVVEAVLQVGRDRQYVILHRSLQDRTIRGVPGASVTVTSEGAPTIHYEESELIACLAESPDEWELEDLEVSASCYLSPLGAGSFVRASATYVLSIETPSGEQLRGRTTVPDLFQFRSPVVDVDPVSLSVQCRIPAVPFDLVWSRSQGAWAYISTLRLSGWGDDLRADGVEVPDPLDLTGVSVSAADTSLLFPANIGLFQRFDLDQRLLSVLQNGLPEDADVTLVVFAADPNYANAVRGGRFNPSGNIRYSSMVGDGVGVFGSIVPLTIHSPESSTSPLPLCPLPASRL